MMKVQKLLCIVLTLCLLVGVLAGCGEAPADPTTTANDLVTTTTVADSDPTDEVVDPTVDPTQDQPEVTDPTDTATTTVDNEDEPQDETTVEDPTTTTKENEKTTVKGGKTTTTKKIDVTTKKTEKTTKKPIGITPSNNKTTVVTTQKTDEEVTTKAPVGSKTDKVTTKTSATAKTDKVTTKTTKTSTTEKTTSTTAATTKVYGTTLYVDWNKDARCLQVVQKYSSKHDLVSIIKPIAPNNILNFVSPKIIANTGDDISNKLSSANHIYSMPESDWLGPHHINGDWHGGSHGHGANNIPTGYSDSVRLFVNGKATDGNVSTYAGEVKLTYTNFLWHPTTKTAFMKEDYTLTFDGEKWTVECTIEMLESVSSWQSYYGMQCTYGAWQETITYGNGAPISLAAANGSTEAPDPKCDTMVLRGKNGHALEMKLDRTFGLGRGSMRDKTSAGAFTSAYPHPNGKAYFLLFNGGRNPSAGYKNSWRGTYRFFCEE